MMFTQSQAYHALDTFPKLAFLLAMKVVVAAAFVVAGVLATGLFSASIESSSHYGPISSLIQKQKIVPKMHCDKS